MTGPEKRGGLSGRGQELKENLEKVSISQKILAAIAVVVVVGWISKGKDFWPFLFKQFFAPFSFFCALALAALVVSRLFGKRPFPPRLERHAVGILSILPVVGFLIDRLKSIPDVLTVGGSIALAYISAITYWKRHIPDFARSPFGVGDAEPEGEAKPEGEGKPEGKASGKAGGADGSAREGDATPADAGREGPQKRDEGQAGTGAP